MLILITLKLFNCSVSQTDASKFRKFI